MAEQRQRTETLEKAKQRAKTLKGLITKNTNLAEDLVKKCKGQAKAGRPEDYYTPQLKELLQQRETACQNALNELYDRKELINSLDKDEGLLQESSYEQYSSIVVDLQTSLLPIYRQCDANSGPAPAAARAVLDATGNVLGVDHGVKRVNRSLDVSSVRPKQLSLKDTSYLKLERWLDRYADYYKLSDSCLDQKDRQVLWFRESLDDPLKAISDGKRAHLDASTMDVVHGANSCFSIIRSIWDARIPLFTRRKDFFDFKQKGKTTLEDAVRELTELRRIARLETITAEEIFLHRVMDCIRDPVMVTYITEKYESDIAPSNGQWNLEALLRYASAFERTQSDAQARGTQAPNPVNVQRVQHQRNDGGKGQRQQQNTGAVPKDRQHGGNKGGNGKSQGKGGGNAQQGKNPVKAAFDERIKDRCWVCNTDMSKDTNHPKAKDCPKKDSLGPCKHCGQSASHVPAVCKKTWGGARKVDKKEEKASVVTVRQNNIVTSEEFFSPRDERCSFAGVYRNDDDEDGRLDTVIVKVKSKKSAPVEIEALPDTGATKCVMSEAKAKELKLPINRGRASNFRLTVADTRFSKIVGTTIFGIEFNGHILFRECLIVSKLSSDLILSNSTSKELGIIKYCGDAKTETVTVIGVAPGKELPKEVADLCDKYKDVFSNEVKPMRIEATHIHLRNMPIRPLRLRTARNVPLHLMKKAEAVISKGLEDGVLARVDVPTEWTSPGMFVPKANGGVRLVVDFKELNKHIDRPVHPFPSAGDIMKQIRPDSKFFCKVDFASGYHQVPLDEESSYLTTFLVPFGRFRYLRSPMGLSSSGDAFCSASDRALDGIDHLKIVDDVLLQDPTESGLVAKLKQMLDRCRENGITLSEDKIEFGQTIEFAGYVLSCDGIRPSPRKVEAIRDFPVPKNVTDVRSFLGLGQQLAAFHPDFAVVTAPLRDLLKKDTAWMWLEPQQEAYEKLKGILTSDAIVKPFVTGLPTYLVTDASRDGLGYALMQEELVDGKEIPRLVQCGSRRTREEETRYSVSELELAAIAWAVDHCRFYLTGSPGFDIITDHKPLKGILDKSVENLTTQRLYRLRQKLADYNFTLRWTAGKTHLIADALSRYPVFSANDGHSDEAVKAARAEASERISTFVHTYFREHGQLTRVVPVQCNSLKENELRQLYDRADEDAIRMIEKDIVFNDVLEAIDKDDEYRRLNVAIREGDWATVADLGFAKNIHQFLSTLGPLVTYETNRMVPPKALRSDLMDLLHRCHPGHTRMVRMAQQYYYWPKFGKDIKDLVESCEVCQRLRGQQPELPEQAYEDTRNAMDVIAADWFACEGRDYLAVVDHFSGYFWIYQVKRKDASTLIKKLSRIFFDFGPPRRLVSDGGPPFGSSEFADWCKKWKIKHTITSVAHARSNGLAESAVKNAKHLLIKTDGDWDTFEEAVAFYRATPRTGSSRSPFELMFKRRVHPYLPVLPDNNLHLEPREDGVEVEPVLRSVHDNAAGTPFQCRKRLTPLVHGQYVRVRNPKTNLWDKVAIVTGHREWGRSYQITTSDGTKTIRNRKDLKPLVDIVADQVQRNFDDMLTPFFKPLQAVPNKDESDSPSEETQKNTSDDESASSQIPLTFTASPKPLRKKKKKQKRGRNESNTPPRRSPRLAEKATAATRA